MVAGVSQRLRALYHELAGSPGVAAVRGSGSPWPRSGSVTHKPRTGCVQPSQHCRLTGWRLRLSYEPALPYIGGMACKKPRSFSLSAPHTPGRRETAVLQAPSHATRVHVITSAKSVKS
jgi:hypothetical protein